MSTSDSPSETGAERPGTTADDVFHGSEPVTKAEDLARNGVFDDGEVEQFLTDLYAMRRSDVA